MPRSNHQCSKNWWYNGLHEEPLTPIPILVALLQLPGLRVQAEYQTPSSSIIRRDDRGASKSALALICREPSRSSHCSIDLHTICISKHITERTIGSEELKIRQPAMGQINFLLCTSQPRCFEASTNDSRNAGGRQ